MTAIAGLWRFDGKPNAAEGCGRMLAAQRMYGPHARAQWSGEDVALGRNLFRTLPEDAFDCQPLVGGGGRFTLVADARLDNRQELSSQLQIPPAAAQHLSDAAILLAGFERWEQSCLDRLVGDYAIALWDGARKSLLLARDPLGQRPLHYHFANNFVAFASMPKGLHALPEVAYAPDEDRISEFLLLLPETGPQSFFRGIERVEPGHVVTVTPNARTARRHWQPTRRRIVLRGAEEYAEALRDQLDQAVKCRLRGAKDVGAHLSGGFDSSAVTATAARLLAPSGRRVIAFTAVPREGYDGPVPRNSISDEGPYAAATAAMYPNVEHILIRSERRSPLDDLDRNFLLYDRPVLNLCNTVWLHSINDAARQRKLTVLLTGQLGNMGLSYDGMELLPELLRSGQVLRLWREARALIARRRMRPRGLLAQTLGPWCPAAIWVGINRLASGRDVRVQGYTALHAHRVEKLKARARQYGRDLAGRPWKDGHAMRLWGCHSVDLGNLLKGTLGGWQIDQRDPTADVRLLEFCLGVPTEQFLSGGVSRSLGKRALADRLPKRVLDEPLKGLQAADWHERLTGIRDRLAAELERLAGCKPAVDALDLARLRGLINAWPEASWERDEVTAKYRYALLRAISTGHFLRRAMGSNL